MSLAPQVQRVMGEVALNYFFHRDSSRAFNDMTDAMYRLVRDAELESYQRGYRECKDEQAEKESKGGS